jgi:hypothetical protein
MLKTIPIKTTVYKTSCMGVLTAILLMACVIPLLAFQNAVVLAEQNIGTLIQLLREETETAIPDVILPHATEIWHTVHSISALVLLTALLIVSLISIKHAIGRTILGVTLIGAPSAVIVPSLLGEFPVEYSFPMALIAGPVIVMGLSFLHPPSCALSRHCAPHFAKEFTVLVNQEIPCELPPAYEPQMNSVEEPSPLNSSSKSAYDPHRLDAPDSFNSIPTISIAATQ